MNHGRIVDVYKFWKAYAIAPRCASVEVGIDHVAGHEEERVIVSLLVDDEVPVSLAVNPVEARAFAEVMTRAIERFPDQPSSANLPDMIMSLRLFADRLDRLEHA